MSGTSADAIDAALVCIGSEPSQLRTEAFVSCEIPDELRERIHAASGDAISLRELARLDVELGERFADCVQHLLERAGVAATAIEGIGSHGQTLGHYPEPEVRASVQIGAAAVLQARTSIPVVSDFRSADLACGGQGAPLTPFVHHACLAVDDEVRAVLNIGGFTNVSFLPGTDAERVVAFDPGPGNALLDRAARAVSRGSERYDVDGRRAARGRIHADVVEELLADPYFAAPPPKSTGHEYFDASFFGRARAALERRSSDPDDLLSTLASLTVESVARQAEQFFPSRPGRWLVYGGGVHNPVLMRGLAERLAPAVVETTAPHGIAPDALEAIAFAVLGWCAARGRPSNLPAATGARRSVCLGCATPPDAFSNLRA